MPATSIVGLDTAKNVFYFGTAEKKSANDLSICGRNIYGVGV